MKSFKKLICLVCICSMVLAMILPTLIPSVAGSTVENEVTLADGSKWIFDSDSTYNTLNTDLDGRYTITTTAPGTPNSAFTLLSNGLYPLSTKFNLRIQESADANTYFGLAEEYTNNLNDENSIRFIRKNAYNGSENTIAIYADVGGSSQLLISKFGYTRNRASEIGVVKQNGSWYMTWNGLVLNGAGKSTEVQEYCKLENHFPKELLEGNASFHIYAGSTSLLYENSFLLQADCSYTDNSFITSSDSYSDRNNPDTVAKSSAPTVKKDENGKYTYTFTSSGTTAALMAPVTEIDPETGLSPEFNMEHFINVSDANVYWMQYSFSNDPTFSDGTEITFKTARLGHGGQAVHFLTSSNVTLFGTNANFYNDHMQSTRYFWFEKNKEKGEIYLYFWGANLVSKAAPHCVNIDFSTLAGKPVYMRVKADSIGATTVNVDVRTHNAAEVGALISELDEIANKVPVNLAEAEEIIAKYDASAYRYAVSPSALSHINVTRAYMLVEREKALQQKLTELRNKIDALPEKADFQSNYSTIVADDIKEAYLEYASLGENSDKLGDAYKTKLNELVSVVVNHADYADKKAMLDAFDTKVNEIGGISDLTVYNYTEKNEKYIGLKADYENFDDLQKALVKTETKIFIENYAVALAAVKEAGEVVNLIQTLPEPQNIKYADLNTVIAVRTAYSNLSDKNLIDATLTAKLDACEVAIEEAKINELDWYAPNNKVTYTGSNKNGYVFANTCDQVGGYIFATTTDKYNLITDELYWVGPTCGGGQFFMLSFTNNVKGAAVTNNSTDTLTFILRPTGGGVGVTFFDAAGESERIAVLNGFNLDAMHTFGTVKGNDGHWYLTIDGEPCNAYSYSRFDNYMELYGEASHIALGGVNGFRANNVAILNKEKVGEVGDWAFSMPFGCEYSGNSTGYNISLTGGAKAIWQKKLEDLAGWSFNINMNSQLQSSWTYIGIVASPEISPSYESGSNGVTLALANRPAAGDYRTHILAFLGGKWVTLTAKEPAIIDADYFNLSIVKETDRHFYLKITWASGSYTAMLDRTNDYYRNMQLDSLLEDGGYLLVQGSEIDIENHYSPYVETEIELEAQPAIDFILELEKRFDKLNAFSKTDYEYMVKQWNNLDFYNRNSVLADLMSDDLAYNIVLTIKDYEKGDLDEYYYETETVEVKRSELSNFINDYASDENTEYTFTYSDGTVIAVSRNLEIPVTKSAEDNSGRIGLVAILGAVFGGAVSFIAVRKRKGFHI